MATIYVLTIPQPGTPQSFVVSLGGIKYTFTVRYRNLAEAGWILDIGDSGNNPIINGIPLVTGANLLAQYAYLNIGGGGGLYVYNPSDPDAVPAFDDLGNVTQLYWVTN
jgi:hypothetical protein